jgi:hypothetical protein
MDMVLCRMAELTTGERADLAALGQAVYPPDVAAEWPGRQLEWSVAEWGVFIRAADGALVSFVGVHIRPGLCDGSPVRIGGIGGVKTHPAARRQGFAARAIGRSTEFFHEQQDIAFGLLVCEQRLIGYYSRLGWQEFTGQLMVTQRGEPSGFTFNRVMVRGVQQKAPAAGIIDLLGPPW